MATVSIWDKLDYNRNAVIEASAGTGKTYTLEHIVEKLVLEKDYDIRSLLLVTFTEKAAGELKERIRKMLAGKEAAKHLDEATICTIHSFCREVLSSYPFESGMTMGVDIGGSDVELCKKAVQSLVSFRKHTWTGLNWGWRIGRQLNRRRRLNAWMQRSCPMKPPRN